MNAKPDDLVTRFLLGELSEQERADVEARFLSDNEFFEEVLSAEDALLDQYLLGQLTDEQRERAESLFRSSDRQSREVLFTEGLIAAVRGAGPAGGRVVHAAGTSEVTPPVTEDPSRALPPMPLGPKNFTPRLAWAGGLFLLLVCFALASWFFYQHPQTRPAGANQAEANRGSPGPRETPSEEAANKEEPGRRPEIGNEKRETPEETRGPRPPRRSESVASILLSPATLERGGGSTTIRLKTGTSKVQLHLELDEGRRYNRYGVLISTFDGRRVWSNDSLDAGQVSKGRIALTLPSSLFGYDDYKIELKGLSEGGEPVHVADYVFKVRD